MWVKRYLAGPGQTIAETESGIAIDGKLLATEVVDPGIAVHPRCPHRRSIDRSLEAKQHREPEPGCVPYHKGTRGLRMIATIPDSRRR